MSTSELSSSKSFCLFIFTIFTITAAIVIILQLKIELFKKETLVLNIEVKK